MLDPRTATAVTIEELDGFLARVDALGADGGRLPVRCEGWTVADLLHHLAWATAAQSTALERVRAGVDDRVARDIPPPGAGSLDPDRGELRRQRDRMVAALGALEPTDLERPCPMPFGVMPGAVALNLTAAEAGIHRNDLLWALGEEDPLPPRVVDALTTIMTAALPALAGGGAAPPGPLALRLAGGTVSYALAYAGGGWTPAVNGSPPDFAVSGDDSAVTLFVMGRIPSTHPSLTVSGDAALAGRFKEFFPGP